MKWKKTQLQRTESLYNQMTKALKECVAVVKKGNEDKQRLRRMMDELSHLTELVQRS